jgi:para-aminobenzoate synthetase component I
MKSLKILAFSRKAAAADLMMTMMIFNQRHIRTYALATAQVKQMKLRMLNWASQFSIVLFLDNNNYQSAYNGCECLLATGSTDVITAKQSAADLLSQLQQLHNEKQDWIFGHISYDYKNLLEPKLTTTHPSDMGFPLFHFFIPETVCCINREQTILTIETFGDPKLIYDAICEADPVAQPIPKLTFTKVIDKDKYLAAIAALREHIADGDCYEINFCNKGFCEQADIVPVEVFKDLNELSPAPFAAFYRLNDRYMMCASPERYLCKTGNKILSQPIKGTARRDADEVKDNQIKETLRNDIKERAENVMIVDLVRNDLARCCEVGSVQVDELFGIYSFPQVHQMISTVSGTLRADVPFTDAIRHSFPMGSMTGAPKFKVMQLIDQYEHSGRGLFSGTVGYISPQGDFDLNVVIRSLFYNAAAGYLSYQTGGAITYDSHAEREWEEMRLKAWALERIFS